jgi:hypothetical protein
VQLDGKDVTKEVWRLWPDLLSGEGSGLPGSGLDRSNCGGWMLGDWVHYGGEPMDRAIFYKDNHGEIIGFEIPILRSGFLSPA